jgi:hypothetical protein
MRIFAVAMDICIDALSRAYVTGASLGHTVTFSSTTRRCKMFPMATLRFSDRVIDWFQVLGLNVIGVSTGRSE